jgi:hypothetical protein
MRHRTLLTIVLSVLSPLFGGRGVAAPDVGAALPSLNASDVTGEQRTLAELVRGPTLLVAITDRDGGDALKAWFDAANTRGHQASRVAVISIGKPFFVSDDYARSRARERIPRGAWHSSLFDTNHAMANALGLEESAVPYAFAISGDGRVLAVIHRTADDPQAARIWNALDRIDVESLGAR